MEWMLRDELRVALRACSLPVSGLKADLIERLLHERGAGALSDEGAAALMFAGRRCGSRPGGLALLDDASAFDWIHNACEEHTERSVTAVTLERLRRRMRGIPTPVGAAGRAAHRRGGGSGARTPR